MPSVDDIIRKKLDPFYLERIVYRKGADVDLSKKAKSASKRTFVLYVVLNSYRARENPALDVAKCLAENLNLPLVVYAFYDDKTKHATHRRATFFLEGARDFQQDLLSEQGLPLVFYLNRAQMRQPYHLTLGCRAVCIVTDEPFVAPNADIVARLSTSCCGTPLISVDTACILPARATSKSWTNRAFIFRSETTGERRKRLKTAYPRKSKPLAAHLRCLKTISQLLPFVPLDLSERAISEIVAQLDIDKSVRAVRHTRGGGSEARRRWKNFVASGRLGRYDKKRNNPLSNGVSRMSAFLNYGHVSPWRVGRDAIEATRNKKTRKGAEKFIDEFFIWRELAYSMCFHHPKHLIASNVLPRWAFETLSAHARDTRRTLELETLERAETGQDLWDVIQKNLAETGEVHNNLRMTWGKQLLHWVSGPPQKIYETIVHLNDKFALDGLSPPSYAGVLWCLGWADSPKPERPIFGRVRYRSAESVRIRYDLNDLRAHGRALVDFKHTQQSPPLLRRFFCVERSAKRLKTGVDVE